MSQEAQSLEMQKIIDYTCRGDCDDVVVWARTESLMIELWVLLKCCEIELKISCMLLFQASDVSKRQD